MMSAFVFIQIGPAQDMSAVHKALHGVAGVKYVHFLAGPTDVLAWAEAEDTKALMNVIGGIRGVAGVTSTDTRIVLPV